MATAMIGIVLILVVITVVRKLVRDKASGKSCCGDCTQCRGGNHCH